MAEEEELEHVSTFVDADGFHLRLSTDEDDHHIRVSDVATARELLSAVSGLRPFIDQMQRQASSGAGGASVHHPTGGTP